MTPKEKCDELVSKFMDIDSDSELFDRFKMKMFYAQRCALIAVDEIINTGLLSFICSDNLFIAPTTEPYWKEVKQEIEKL